MTKLFKEFTAAQLARLKKEYDPLKGKRIPMNQIEKMQTMLSKYSTDMLVKLANTDIPFIATAAKNIAVMKRGKKWSDFKTKLDMAEADELQCEACWDSHKQVGTKISSRTGKRVPNCVPKEELQEVLDMQEGGQKELVQLLMKDIDSLSDKEFKTKHGKSKEEMKKSLEGVQEALNKDDEKSVDDVVKQLKKAVKAHQGQVKSLTKDLKDEADMSKSQIKKAHDKADDLPKKDFIKRYGKDGDAVRYATATNMVKKKLGIEDMEENKKITISKIKNNKIKNDIMVMVKKDNLNISLTPSSNGVQADGDEKDILKLVKGLNNKHMSNIINPSNPPYVINMEEAFTKKDFKDNERDNEHGENAKIVVGMFGTPQDVAVIDAINARHKKQRYISREDQKKRDTIVNKYYKKLKEERVLTNPEVAAALRQYIAQRPFISNKKDYEELMKLSLKDMNAFNTKYKSMNTDSKSGVKAALSKKGLSSTLVNDNKPKGDQTMNESYKDKFNATMKKFGINSLDDLKSDEEKKKFFKAVDDSHDAKNEELTPAQKKLPAGLQKAIAAKQGDKKDEMMTKEMMDEMMKEMMKEMSSKMEMLKAEKDPTKVEMMKKEMYEMVKKEMAKMSEMDDMPEMSEMMKKEMMKEMMKKMDEYGSMNAMKEGFSSDAQRKAAFASGYKEKDKKKDEMAKINAKHKPGHNEMAMNAMKMNAMKMPIQSMYKMNAMKTGDDDLTPMNNMKMNAMIKDPHKSKEEDPKRDMNATYMKSDVRADVKNGGGIDMSKVKDAPKMQTAMKKINAMYKTERYHDTKPGSIQDVVNQMYHAEHRLVTVEDKKLDDMIKQYMSKGGTITKLPPALQKGSKPSDMKKHQVGAKGIVKSMKMKEVREFISTYNSHFLTNFKAEEFILKD